MQFQPKRLRFPRPGWNLHTLAPALLFLLYLPFSLTGGEDGSLSRGYLLFGLNWENGAQGHLWTLFSYSLLHGNWIHWLTNAYCLYYFGGRIHDIFGEKEVWRTVLFSILGGGLFHLFFQGGNLLVGASGAAVGLFVALTTVSPESKMFPLPIRARNLRNGVILATLLLLLMLPSLGVPLLSNLGRLLIKEGGEAFFQIGHACHLGGALAGGLAMRKYFRKPITLAQLQQQRAAREEDGDQAA